MISSPPDLVELESNNSKEILWLLAAAESDSIWTEWVAKLKDAEILKSAMTVVYHVFPNWLTAKIILASCKKDTLDEPLFPTVNFHISIK